jgi:hypothetical protein
MMRFNAAFESTAGLGTGRELAICMCGDGFPS